jgi:hypothetical protein
MTSRAWILTCALLGGTAVSPGIASAQQRAPQQPDCLPQGVFQAPVPAVAPVQCQPQPLNAPPAHPIPNTIQPPGVIAPIVNDANTAPAPVPDLKIPEIPSLPAVPALSGGNYDELETRIRAIQDRIKQNIAAQASRPKPKPPTPPQPMEEPARHAPEPTHAPQQEVATPTPPPTPAGDPPTPTSVSVKPAADQNPPHHPAPTHVVEPKTVKPLDTSLSSVAIPPEILRSPLDKIAMADNLYAAGSVELALSAYQSAADSKGQPAQTRWAEYQIANCLRRLGRMADAEKQYRKIAASRDGGEFIELSKWWLDSLSQRAALVRQLDQIKAVITASQEDRNVPASTEPGTPVAGGAR